MAYIPAVASQRLVSTQGAKAGTGDLVIICGQFETVNGAAVTNVKGEGFHVQRDDEGQFTVKFPGCVGKGVLYKSAHAASVTTTDAEDVFAQAGIYTKATGIMEINCAAISAPTTESDIPGSVVSFMVVFHDRDSLDITYTA